MIVYADGVSLGTILDESNEIEFADGASLGTSLDESNEIEYSDGASLGTSLDESNEIEFADGVSLLGTVLAASSTITIYSVVGVSLGVLLLLVVLTESMEMSSDDGTELGT